MQIPIHLFKQHNKVITRIELPHYQDSKAQNWVYIIYQNVKILILL